MVTDDEIRAVQMEAAQMDRDAAQLRLEAARIDRQAAEERLKAAQPMLTAATPYGTFDHLNSPRSVAPTRYGPYSEKDLRESGLSVNGSPEPA